MNKILAITILILCYFLYLAVKRDVVPKKDYDAIIKKIEAQNDSLLKSIELHKKEIQKYAKRVDSLEEVKNKVIVKFKNKENEIDKGSSAYLVSEFEGIFSNSGIK